VPLHPPPFVTEQEVNAALASTTIARIISVLFIFVVFKVYNKPDVCKGLNDHQVIRRSGLNVIGEIQVGLED